MKKFFLVLISLALLPSLPTHTKATDRKAVICVSGFLLLAGGGYLVYRHYQPKEEILPSNNALYQQQVEPSKTAIAQILNNEDNKPKESNLANKPDHKPILESNLPKATPQPSTATENQPAIAKKPSSQETVGKKLPTYSDAQRVALEKILLNNLNSITPHNDKEEQSYFDRLNQLGWDY